MKYTNDDKVSALKFIKSLSNKYGDRTVAMFDNFDSSIDFIPSGNEDLDILLGGGWPTHSNIEVYGNESVGKTTLCLSIIKAFQLYAPQMPIAYFNLEPIAFTGEWAGKNDLDRSTFALFNPNDAEQCFDMMADCMENGFGLIILDSVAGLSPKAEQENDIGKEDFARGAKLLARFLRKTTTLQKEKGTTVIYVNQLRDKIGGMGYDTDKTTGGRALPFYASVRLKLSVFKTLKSANSPIGIRTKIKCVKNKIASGQGYEAFISIYKDTGLDEIAEYLYKFGDSGVMRKSSASWINNLTGEKKYFEQWRKYFNSDDGYDEYEDLKNDHITRLKGGEPDSTPKPTKLTGNGKK